MTHLPVPESLRPPARPWGFWATIGFSVLILALFVITQTLAGSLSLAQRLGPDPELDPMQLTGSLIHDGSVITLALLLSTPPCLGAIWAITALRRGLTPWTYLQLTVPHLSQLGGWLGITAATILTLDTFKALVGIEIVPTFSTDIYRTAGSLPLLYLAVVALAPLFEEMLFRGFLLQGFRCSWLGSTGAIWVTSVIWAVIHTQYDLINILTIVLFGLLLGIAQMRTQSLLIPIAMHALNNLISMVQAAGKIGVLS